MEPVRKVRLVDQIVERLRDNIVDGTLLPGTALKQEQLAAQLGVSRTPLREAFRALEQDGLLRIIPSNNTVEVIRLSNHDIIELYQIREVIDGLATSLAASRVDQNADVLEELDGLIADLQSVESFDTLQFIRAHNAFHAGIVRASGNRWLLQLLPIVSTSAQMLYPVLGGDPERVAESGAEHGAILEKIKAGDVEQARELAEQHIRNALEHWTSAEE